MDIEKISAWIRAAKEHPWRTTGLLLAAMLLVFLFAAAKEVGSFVGGTLERLSSSSTDQTGAENVSQPAIRTCSHVVDVGSVPVSLADMGLEILEADFVVRSSDKSPSGQATLKVIGNQHTLCIDFDPSSQLNSINLELRRKFNGLSEGHILVSQSCEDLERAAFEFRFSEYGDARIRSSAGTHNIAARSGVWHQVQFENFDFQRQLFDFSVGSNTVDSEIKFENSIAYIGCIAIFNKGQSEIWLSKFDAQQ